MILAPAAFAGMCPLCRQTLAMGGSEGLIQGFYWSILLIAGMPILILIFAAFYSYRMSKKLIARHYEHPNPNNPKADRERL